MEFAETIPQDVSEASARHVEQQRLWIGVAALASGAMVFAQGIIAARTLGPADFGTLAIVIAAVTSFRVVATLRTRGAVIHLMNDALVDRDFAYAGASLKAAGLLEACVTLLAAAAAWELAPLAAHAFTRDPGMTGLIRVYALTIPFTVLTQTALGVLQYFGRFDVEMMVRTADRAATLAATVGAVMVGGTLDAFVVAATIGPCVGGLLLAGLGIAEAYRRLGERWARAPLSAMAGRWGALIRGSVRGTLQTTLAAVAREGDPLWIAWFSTPIMAGYYALAAGLAGVALVPAAPFAQRAFPHVARLAAQQRWREVYAIRARSVMLVGVGVAVVLIMFGVDGQELLGEVYGRAFEPATNTLIILLGAGGIAAIAMWARPILLALGLAPANLLTTLLTGAIKIAGVLLLVRPLGAEGCALATAVAWAIASGLMALRARAAARVGAAVAPPLGAS